MFDVLTEGVLQGNLLRESMPMSAPVAPGFHDRINKTLLHREGITIEQPTLNGKRWRVVIIESGTSANRNYYSPQVLREAAPMWENTPIRIYTYDGRKGRDVHNDHVPTWASTDGKGGNVSGNTVGFLRNIRFESVHSIRQNRSVPALTGELVFIDDSVRSRIWEAYQEGAMDPSRRALFELSIEAEGPHHKALVEGMQVNRVERIERVRETTIVSEASAGGKFIGVMESALGTIATHHPRNVSVSGYSHQQESNTCSTNPSPMPMVVQESRVRQVLVKMLRALGYAEPLESQTTAQLHKTFDDFTSQVDKQEGSDPAAEKGAPGEDAGGGSPTPPAPAAAGPVDQNAPSAPPVPAPPGPPGAPPVADATGQAPPPAPQAPPQPAPVSPPPPAADGDKPAEKPPENPDVDASKSAPPEDSPDKPSGEEAPAPADIPPGADAEGADGAPETQGEEDAEGKGPPIPPAGEGLPPAPGEAQSPVAVDGNIPPGAEPAPPADAQQLPPGLPPAEISIDPATGQPVDPSQAPPSAGPAVPVDPATGAPMSNQVPMPPVAQPEAPPLPPEPDPLANMGDLRKCAQYLRAGDLDSSLTLLEKVLAKATEREAADNRYSPNANLTALKGSMQESTSRSEVALIREIIGLLVEAESSECNLRMEPLMNVAHQTEPNGGSIPGSLPAPQAPVQESAMAGLTHNDLVKFIQFQARNDVARDRQLAEATQRLEQYDQQNALRESASTLHACLRQSGLSREAQQILAEQFDGQIVHESVVLDAIDRQRRLCESYVGMQGQGAYGSTGVPSQHMQRHGVDWFRAEIRRAFGYEPSKDQTLTESEQDTYRNLSVMPSIKTPFIRLYDDPHCFLNGYVGPYALIKEATSLDLPKLLGDSMYRALLQQYQDQPALWREVSNVVPVANFKTQRRILVGGLGILPRVTEGDTAATYLSIGFPRDVERTYNIGTFGGLIIVTRQAIINDDLQGIQGFPREAASSAVMTLNLNVFKALMGMADGGALNTDLSYTGLQMYHAGHNNLTNTGGLSYQNLCDMLERLSEQRRFGNVSTLTAGITTSDTTATVSAAFLGTLKVGDKIRVYGGSGDYVVEVRTVTNLSGTTITVNSAFSGDHSNASRIEQLGPPIAYDEVRIIHANQVKAQMFQLLASSLVPGMTINDASALYPDFINGKLKPIALHSMFLNDLSSNFFLTAGKPIECGFLGGKEEPEILLQDNPLVDRVFTGDQISWKVRHEHGQLMTDHLRVAAGIF